MSSTASPISPHHFAEAIQELPLANLHFKAAEIRNSIFHLEHSNEQLQSFADKGDRDCGEAIHENRGVVERMEIRIGLLRMEVERRGFIWSEDEGVAEKGERTENGDVQIDDDGTIAERLPVQASVARPREEFLASQSVEQVQESTGEEDVYL